ncbi:MAG: NADH:flavin oxidoreductase [Bacteroidales bacterium]|nr:NADH:flavin oxidoreductase [Bacteroidales bacterium]
MISKEYTSFKLRSLVLKNRFIKTATYEGMCDNGRPTQQLIDFHSRTVAGGIAMTTVAYGAVNPDGRTHEHQMYLHPRIAEPLKELTDAVHKASGKVSIQLTHCGFFSRNKNIKGKKPMGPSRVLNTYGIMSGLAFSRAMTLEEIKQTARDFANAAEFSLKVGFDAVEIHMGHGYLLSQFLTPRINKRKDKYGGSLENRMRLPLEVIAETRQAVGEEFPILVKMNLSDGFKGGFTIADSIEVAKALEQAGVDALILSGGYTSKTPFYLMRGDIPIWDMTKVEKNWLQKIAIASFGRFIIRKYDFSENFFIPLALKVRKAVKMPLVYVGGVVSRQGIEEIMKEKFDMIALGRALIHDPDFILKIKEGSVDKSECNQCNICVAEMDRGGVRCVL